MSRAIRSIAALLLLILLCQPFLAFCEESSVSTGDDPEAFAQETDDPDALAGEEEEDIDSEEDAIKHTARSNVGLKVRRGPGLEYGSLDSIAKDEIIYIIELGTEWAKVQAKRNKGYVQCKYLLDIRDYNPRTGTTGSEVSLPEEVIDYTADNADDFKRGYKASAVKAAIVYAEPDERSKYVTKVPIYKELIVSHVEGDWCYVMYEKRVGWTLCRNLFKWDRIDPYVGDIPGCIVYPTLAFVGSTTDIRDYAASVAGKKKIETLKTINPGAALAVEKPDEAGRYKTPYWRTTGYITDEDIVYTMDVVPYDQAQPGDLISVMTTYYAVGVHTLQYQGRNWNIYLSTTMISGKVLQPGEEFNVNKVIGPYRKSTGYRPAPIMSPNALWGYGGGTCQVNTTLYNTIIRLPIYVSHRRVHADVGIKYMLKGFDAAVGGGDTNMIFTNTLPYAIRFTFMMSDGVLTCCIFRVE